jgi:hypothetical protein
MSRTDIGAHTPESLNTIAAALEAISGRLTRTAEAMKQKNVASLAVKNQAVLKAGIVAVRGFGMAAEEALEEWVFDQNVFKEATEPAGETPRTRPATPGRKPKKEPDALQEGSPPSEPPA